MTTPRADRPYAVVVLGATGFTGRLVAEYLARTVGVSIPWAIAGRSAAKLDEVHRALIAIDPDCAKVAVLTADVGDDASLDRLAAATRVLLSTVGPYARYGMPVVRACVEQGCDYVDITGEPAFVKETVERYDEAARAKGLRVVSCCGFDSIPHDLGVLYTVMQLPEGEPISIEGMVRAKGGVSGGTWHSAINAFADLKAAMKSARLPTTPLPGGRKVRASKAGLHYDRKRRAWLAPLPTIDPWIVLRSARGLDRYGPDFRYGHFAEVRSTAMLVGGAAGIAGVAALAQFKPTRDWLLGRINPGEGPSEEVRAKGWFTVTFKARGGGRDVVTRVSGGEAGYAETSKMVAESALCLALDRDALPPHTGVVTTAMGMGEALIVRLQKAGIAFKVLEG
ncbi:MAG: saccharopine dehydrogenase [Myxococcaceae bacterium]|nr:saccharopine dehydrogenase [Myxococcaceae bacterium]